MAPIIRQYQYHPTLTPHTLLHCHVPGAYDTYHIYCYRDTPTFCISKRNNMKAPGAYLPSPIRCCPTGCYLTGGYSMGSWVLSSVDAVAAKGIPEQSA